MQRWASLLGTDFGYLSVPSSSNGGICVDCYNNYHCSGSQICSGLTCVEPECTSDSDCPAHGGGKYYDCTNHSCVQKTKPNCPSPAANTSINENCSCPPNGQDGLYWTGGIYWSDSSDNWVNTCTIDGGGCEFSSTGTNVLPVWAAIALLGFFRRRLWRRRP